MIVLFCINIPILIQYYYYPQFIFLKNLSFFVKNYMVFYTFIQHIQLFGIRASHTDIFLIYLTRNSNHKYLEFIQLLITSNQGAVYGYWCKVKS